MDNLDGQISDNVIGILKPYIDKVRIFGKGIFGPVRFPVKAVYGSKDVGGRIGMPGGFPFNIIVECRPPSN